MIIRVYFGVRSAPFVRTYSVANACSSKKRVWDRVVLSKRANKPSFLSLPSLSRVRFTHSVTTRGDGSFLL